MTLVVCWRDELGVTVAADTKISDHGTVTYTDGGPKIFLVPITATQSIGRRTRRRQYPAMGFAYAGSSLIAQSVHAMATTCLQNLSGNNSSFGPSMLEVADLFMKCAVQYTKEMTFWRTKSAPYFEAFIFGFCPKLQDYLVYHLRPTVIDGLLNIRHDGHYVTFGGAFVIGSGREEFKRILADHNRIGEPLSVFENFELVLNGKKVPSVGGSRQYAAATLRGVELVPGLIPVDGEPGQCRIEVLGCDVSTLGDVGNYSIGHSAIGAGIKA